MAKLEDLDPTLDPVVKAAMLDDEDDSEETTPTKDTSTDEDKEVDQKETKDSPKDDTEEDDEKVDSKEGDKVDEDEVPEKRKSEDESKAEDDEKPKQTRKQKREAKRQRYIEAIKREGEQTTARRRDDLFSSDPDYKPLDYNASSELEVDDLAKDRDQYGRKNSQKGAELERHLSAQETFWNNTEYEAKLLQTDPKYAFLNESDPDTFDPDKAADLNEVYLELVGYDPQTNSVRRTDISWEKFVKAEVARIERWADEQADESLNRRAEQRSQAGIRPSGSPRKGLGKLKPGDISRMSQSEFEKNEAEIDRQILAQLGE